MREGDEIFLHSLREVVRLSRKTKPDDEEDPTFIEYIFEAYYFLRRRDGEGSPLPTKAEVKNTAALIAAFYKEGLVAKLSGFLWNRSKLTDDEFRRVAAMQLRLLKGRNKNGRLRDHGWPQRLAAAGLSDLPQKKRGEK